MATVPCPFSSILYRYKDAALPTAGRTMAISVTELREKARLLEGEFGRVTAISDSLDTRAGVAIGFAGVLAGLLVQVRSPGTTLRAAAFIALIYAVAGVATAAPRRLAAPDPLIIADLYNKLPEQDATEIASRATLRAIDPNTGIAQRKRLLLIVTVVGLVAAVFLAAIGVR
jgi:hypothetical protein